MVVLGVVIGLLVLVFLVAIHELGHAVVAKRNGVKVEEYGIGFPPRAKKWQPKQSFLGKNVVSFSVLFGNYALYRPVFYNQFCGTCI